MTDETDKPPANLGSAENAINQQAAADADLVAGDLKSGIEPETAPPSAAERLRAFEDKHLGPNTPRFQGKIERGHGAPLRFLSDELRAEHAALERAESEKGA